MTLVAAGIEPGQEVILPGITWPSVVYAIIKAGGVPRTVDISAGSLCLTAEAVEEAITERTFAVLATHLFGSQCDMEALCEVAARHRVLVIEDAAQAVGAVQRGRSCGTWGLAGAFSLNDKKVLACGEGGVIVTDDNELMDELRIHQLILPERANVPATVPGTYKISEFQAAVGLGQLEKLPVRLEIMHRNADRLAEVLATRTALISRQAVPPGVTTHTLYNFCFNVEGPRTPLFRHRLSEELGLRVSLPYRPLREITDFHPSSQPLDQASRQNLDLRHPNCEDAYRERTLRLPHYVLRSNLATIDRLAHTIVDLFDASIVAR